MLENLQGHPERLELAMMMSDIGTIGDADKARAAYLHRCKANSLAAKGEWTEVLEQRRPY